MLLTETTLAKPIIEEKDGSQLPDSVLCRVTYNICNIGERNANGRIYEQEVWDKVLGDGTLQEMIQNRRLFGQAEHPVEAQSDLQLTSHVIHKMWMDESGGNMWQTVDILDTPMGRIVDSLIRSECGVGMSTRAEGDLEESEDEQGKFSRVIPESYRYITTDFTADPSTFNVLPQEIKRGVVSTVQNEMVNESASEEERAFAKTLMENLKCEGEDEKCGGCGCCNALGEKRSSDAEGEMKNLIAEGRIKESQKVEYLGDPYVIKSLDEAAGAITLRPDIEGRDVEVEQAEVLVTGSPIITVAEDGTVTITPVPSVNAAEPVPEEEFTGEPELEPMPDELEPQMGEKCADKSDKKKKKMGEEEVTEDWASDWNRQEDAERKAAKAAKKKMEETSKVSDLSKLDEDDLVDYYDRWSEELERRKAGEDPLTGAAEAQHEVKRVKAEMDSRGKHMKTESKEVTEGTDPSARFYLFYHIEDSGYAPTYSAGDYTVDQLREYVEEARKDFEEWEYTMEDEDASPGLLMLIRIILEKDREEEVINSLSTKSSWSGSLGEWSLGIAKSKDEAKQLAKLASVAEKKEVKEGMDQMVARKEELEAKKEEGKCSPEEQKELDELKDKLDKMGVDEIKIKVEPGFNPEVRKGNVLRDQEGNTYVVASIGPEGMRIEPTGGGVGAGPTIPLSEVPEKGYVKVGESVVPDIDLRIKEASTRAEKEKALEVIEDLTAQLESLTHENSEARMKFGMLMKKLKEATKVYDEIDALRAKLEEKAKIAYDSEKALEEAKTESLKEIEKSKAEVQTLSEAHAKEVKSLTENSDSRFNKAKEEYEQKVTEAKEEGVKEGTSKVLDEYVARRLAELDLSIGENTRALLDKCESIKDVEDILEKTKDMQRRNALHSESIKEVRVRNQHTKDPEQDEINKNVGDVMKAMG